MKIYECIQIALDCFQPIVNAARPPLQRIIRAVDQSQPVRSIHSMTIIPRIVPASPAGFDKSLEQLLQTPVTLFQCQLCAIYLPRKDVTLSHIRRIHRVEDDLRAANNCLVVKKTRAQATPVGNEPPRVIKTDADGFVYLERFHSLFIYATKAHRKLILAAQIISIYIVINAKQRCSILR